MITSFVLHFTSTIVVLALQFRTANLVMVLKQQCCNMHQWHNDLQVLNIVATSSPSPGGASPDPEGV